MHVEVLSFMSFLGRLTSGMTFFASWTIHTDQFVQALDQISL